MRIPNILKRTPEIVIIPIIAICAFLPRLIMAVTTFTSTVDTSTVGIMGLRILQGDRPLFYYGQQYMGALEGYCTALIFKLFGASVETLTLVPTLFAIAWSIATYYLVRRIFNRMAAVAAAFCIAIPGWYTIWYTLGSYGGYPETYFFGTIAILLALQLADPDMSDPAPTKVALLGSVFALGIWTNLQVLPFFAVAGVILGLNWLLYRRSIKRFLALVASGCVALLGLVPSLIATKDSDGGGMVGLPDLSRVPHNLNILLHDMLPKLLWWKTTEAVWLRSLIAIGLLIPVIYYLLTLLQRTTPWKRYIPVLFCFIFLGLYLPHSMAAIGAPRYAISIVVVLISSGFAAMLCSRWRAVRTAGILLTAGWILYNGIEISRKCIAGIPEKRQKMAARMDVINTAEAHGLNSVMLVSSSTGGLRGLILSFYSLGKIPFAACFSERVYAHSDAWEKDDNGGYAFRPGVTHYITGALDAVRAKYELIPLDLYSLATDIKPVFTRQRCVSNITIMSQVGFDGSTNAVIDRSASTCIRPKDDSQRSITCKLPSRMLVDGLRLFGVDDKLPSGPYTIFASLDGETFTQEQRVMRRTAQSYRAGNRVYLKGHFTAQDILIEPTEALFIKLQYDATPGDTPDWNLSEIIIMEHLSPSAPVTDIEIASIAKHLQSKTITFTYCDRWLSRKLEGLLPESSQPGVFPTYNTRYPESQLSRRINIDPNHAYIVDRSYKDQVASLLSKVLPDESGLAIEEMEHYAIFTISKLQESLSDRGLVWNGHTILKD